MNLDKLLKSGELTCDEFDEFVETYCVYDDIEGIMYGLKEDAPPLAREVYKKKRVKIIYDLLGTTKGGPI